MKRSRILQRVRSGPSSDADRTSDTFDAAFPVLGHGGFFTVRRYFPSYPVSSKTFEATTSMPMSVSDMHLLRQSEVQMFSRDMTSPLPDHRSLANTPTLLASAKTDSGPDLSERNRTSLHRPSDHHSSIGFFEEGYASGIGDVSDAHLGADAPSAPS